MFKHALLPIEAEPDDAKLAALLDGTGYADAVTESAIHKLLPIFPGGTRNLYQTFAARTRAGTPTAAATVVEKAPAVEINFPNI